MQRRRFECGESSGKEISQGNHRIDGNNKVHQEFFPEISHGNNID